MSCSGRSPHSWPSMQHTIKKVGLLGAPVMDRILYCAASLSLLPFPPTQLLHLDNPELFFIRGDPFIYFISCCHFFCCKTSTFLDLWRGPKALIPRSWLFHHLLKLHGILSFPILFSLITTCFFIRDINRLAHVGLWNLRQSQKMRGTLQRFCKPPKFDNFDS